MDPTQLLKEFHDNLDSALRIFGWPMAAFLIFRETKKILSPRRYMKHAELFDEYVSEDYQIDVVTISDHKDDDVDIMIVDRLIEVDHEKKYKDIKESVQENIKLVENDEEEFEIVSVHRKKFFEVLSILKAA